jgi:hypothetical protein
VLLEQQNCVVETSIKKTVAAGWQRKQMRCPDAALR